MAQHSILGNPRVIGANGTAKLANGKVHGFLCTVSGTLTLTDGGGNTILNAMPVTAGLWTDIPIAFTPGDQAAATLAGGAAGTLVV